MQIKNGVEANKLTQFNQLNAATMQAISLLRMTDKPYFVFNPLTDIAELSKLTDALNGLLDTHVGLSA